MILTVAMLISGIPAVFAENDANSIGAVTEQEAISDNQDEITKDNAEEISGEGEENSEEQISLMSRENDVSLPADEVQYSTDGSTWKNATLSDAVTAIGKSTGTIKVMKDITLTEGLYIMGDITIIPGTTEDVTIKRGFANGTDASKGNSGDAMITMFMYNNTLNEWHNLTGKLTLGSTESGSAKLIFDGNSTQYGSNCNAPILYLLGNPQILPNGVGSCTINNVVFQNNTNSSSGGAICINDNTYLQINDSVFQNCKAKKGGAVYYGNTQLDDAFQSKVTFNNTVFKNNEAENGGALYYDNSITTIENCTFEANTVSGSNGGAAIYTNKFQKVTDKSGNVIEGTETQLKIDSCSFKDNNCIGNPIHPMSAFSYLVSNSIYLNATVDEKTVVLDGKINFDDKTDSDICLYAYGYGSTSYKNVVYLGDNFSSDSAIKVMAGAYAIASASDVAGTYNIPIFKCSSAGKAADYAKLFTPADDGSYEFCNKASQVTFIQDATDTTGISLAEYVEPEVELEYAANGTTKKEKMTYAKALELVESTNPTDYKLTVLKSFAVSKPWTRSSEQGIVAAEGLAEKPVITRAEGYTGPIVDLSNGILNISGVVMDGENREGITSPLINAKKGSGYTPKFIIKDVVLKKNNNMSENSKGGAIYVENAELGKTTSGAPVECKNVTIENCSAVYGGAIYQTGNQPMYLNNFTFKGNTADTGSAIYMAENDAKATLTSCTFEDNNFKNDSGNTDNISKSSVIFLKKEENGGSDSKNIEFKDGITFTNNQTNADIVLDKTKSMATSDNNAPVYMDTTTENKGDIIRVVSGAFSEHENNINKSLIYASQPKQKTAFKLVPRYSSNLDSSYMLGHVGTYSLGVVKETSITTVGVSYESYQNGNKVIQRSNIDSFNDGEKVVNISVTPELESQGVAKLSKTYNYTLNVKEGVSAEFEEVYLGYTQGLDSIIIKGDINENKKTATFSLTPDLLSAVYLSNGGQYSFGNCTLYIKYNCFVNLTITSIESGKNATISATANDGTTVSAGETKKIPAGKVTFTGDGDDFGYIDGGDATIIFNTVNNIPTYTINSLINDVTIKVGYKHTTSVQTATGGETKVYAEKLAAFKHNYSSLSKNSQGVWLTPNDNYKVESVKVQTGSVEINDYGIEVYNEESQKWEKSNDFAKQGKYRISFYMPDDDVIIIPTYAALAQTIAIDSSVTGGTISTNPSGSANVGATVTLTATPNDEYNFSSWNVYKTGDTSAKVTVSGNTFTMPDYPVTVSAVFVKKTHDVTITKEGEGTVAISPETPVEVGQTVTVTATPDEYWELSSLTMNGEDITSAKSFVMPNKAVELKATFVKQKFSVTASATTNGTIELLTDSPLNWGDSFTINVKAAPHYEIDTVTVDGKTVTVDGQGDYTFVMPTHDVTISATFKKVKYTITGQGDNVTFDIPSSDTYTWGDIVEFTVTPAQWYTIDSVTIPNIEITDKGNGKYSFVMPSRNVTIKVIASKPMHTITFDTKGGNAVQSVTVANGDSFEKTIPTWAGRGFAGWYLDEECTQKYDFTQPVTGNLELYARWFLWGDVNNDGVADSYDALLIRRCRVGLTDYSMITNRMAGFVNGFEEGRRYPDSGDAVSIRRYRVGLISRYKVEDSAAGYEYDLENDTHIPNN